MARPRLRDAGAPARTGGDAMSTQNLEYYRHRAEEELAAAATTREPGIAQIHREMAQRYRVLLPDDVSAAEDSGGPNAGPGTILA